MSASDGSPRGVRQPPAAPVWPSLEARDGFGGTTPGCEISMRTLCPEPELVASDLQQQDSARARQVETAVEIRAPPHPPERHLAFVRRVVSVVHDDIPDTKMRRTRLGGCALRKGQPRHHRGRHDIELRPIDRGQSGVCKKGRNQRAANRFHNPDVPQQQRDRQVSTSANQPRTFITSRRRRHNQRQAKWLGRMVSRNGYGGSLRPFSSCRNHPAAAAQSA